MVHCGYEATAVDDTFSSLRGLWQTAKATFSSYKDPTAIPAPNLVQINPGKGAGA